MFLTHDNMGTEEERECSRLNATLRVTVSVSMSACPWKYLNISISMTAMTHSFTACFIHIRCVRVMFISVLWSVQVFKGVNSIVMYFYSNVDVIFLYESCQFRYCICMSSYFTLCVCVCVCVSMCVCVCARCENRRSTMRPTSTSLNPTGALSTMSSKPYMLPVYST